ncbi:MAG: type II/IV secretion system protein [Calditrichaeota bacterium]|nr:MAG: type II/IV secretion system protein [Calditrichota bacterium]
MLQEIDIADKLGFRLLTNAIVDFETLEAALRIRQQEDPQKQRSLAQILVEDFELDRDQIFEEVKNLYGFRQIRLSEEEIDDNRIAFIRKMFEPLPEYLQERMKQDKILILRYDHRNPSKLIIVAADPTNRIIPSIARALGVKKYEVCYMRYAEVQSLLERAFPLENEFLREMNDSQQLELTDEEIEEELLDEEKIESEINKSALVNLVEGMLVEAVRKGASDIHIVPKDKKTTEIAFRIDGKLQPWHIQEGIRPEALAAVVKDRSKNIDRFEREKAQDGFIQRKVDNHMIRFRVSVMPIVGRELQYKFESIVIRILDDRKVITDLDKLGFQGKAKEFFIKAISKPQGMVIVTGPTGSGKSTTLMAALNYIIRPEINVLTVEDPVEYIIPGARQLKVGTKMGFEQALRSILRHDPDVVMVGEIRDRTTAETAIKLANTGHLTFSTLHTNDAPSAVSRLYKMGIEPFLIAYAINVIIAQRLIRRLCDHCKAAIPKIDPSIPAALGMSQEEIKNTVFYRAVGCDKCNGGYKGRVAIHECLYFSRAVRKMIFRSGSEIDEEALRELGMREGMQTLRQAALERVKQGITTLEEVAKSTTDD